MLTSIIQFQTGDSPGPVWGKEWGLPHCRVSKLTTGATPSSTNLSNGGGQLSKGRTRGWILITGPVALVTSFNGDERGCLARGRLDWGRSQWSGLWHMKSSRNMTFLCGDAKLLNSWAWECILDGRLEIPTCIHNMHFGHAMQTGIWMPKMQVVHWAQLNQCGGRWVDSALLDEALADEGSRAVLQVTSMRQSATLYWLGADVVAT
jgi:hypothetical protein